MKFRGCKPMLRTWDLPGTLAFYTQVLGFRCDAHEESWGWGQVSRDGVTLMFSGPNEHEGDLQPEFTGSLYIEIDDPDALFGLIADRARVCYPVESFEYGMREFAIYDNNGYLLQFGCAIKDDIDREIKS